MRLQTFLSKAGLASRRSAVKIIRSGKILINGIKVFEPSHKVDPEKDKVLFNNKRIVARRKIYVMLHKPKGVTTTKRDPFAARTVMDLLPPDLSHLNPVGRLDKDTTGLILLTNDGELINKFTHPRFNVKKTYEVRIDRKLSDLDRIRLEKGVKLDEIDTLPCQIRPRGRMILEMTIREGRKRQIKRMFSKLGYKVMDLKRLREGTLVLGTLPEGRWRFLTQGEIITKLMAV